MNPDWTLKGGRLCQPAPFCLVGIVNTTPDSFYDGGRYTIPEIAVEHALLMLAQGADMIDLGAESTRPGAESLGSSPEEAAATEWDRLRPALTGIRRVRPEAIVCIDTCYASTAHQALELGADVINDVSGWDRDPALLDVLVQHKPGYVLMHGGDKGGALLGEHGQVMDRLLRFFEKRLAALVKAGVPETHVVLDPGIGFGKTNTESAHILRAIDRLHTLGRPLYVGLSMKSLFGELLGIPLESRGCATSVTVALLADRGVTYHRVHDVEHARQALGVTQWFAEH